MTTGRPRVDRAWFQRLKLNDGEPLSKCAFNSNLRLYSENASGIVNLAEPFSGDMRGGFGGDDLEDQPDMTPEELVDATLKELTGILGTWGVVAEVGING